MYSIKDDIIKRRLLIDGEGGNDDKRLNNLLRTFVRWCSSPEDEDSDMAYHRMMATLAQCEFVMEKSLLVSEMNLKEQENYEKLSRDIADKIQQAATNIAECKQELQQAKRIRKNRQEYDALAKIIQQHPDRQETTKQLQALDKELTSLAETKESLEGKLDLRRKQFLVLITAIHELQRILEEDEKEAMET
ncbi:THO complex subunit 7 homolog isoform X1 [Gigantopelta aegis]|uniref:THO complex subunit 7 homolog isoform X1 n=1 Tax=Gigantopelta aegis TaxID=1735272 RepID=UPI001B8891ED|nr:THO complex subunit 7 homolog isoform X1 [Gigantopelta aegis]